MGDEFKERLSYLISGSSDFLPSSYIKLRSYLNIHSSKLAGEVRVKAFRNKNEFCPYCFSVWTCDTSSFKILPSKKVKKRNRKTKVNPEEKETAQRNVMLMKCKVCTRKSQIKLFKKKFVKESTEKKEEKPSKKKKKKKDKSCGLLLSLRKTGASTSQQVNFKQKKGLQPVPATKIKETIKVHKNNETVLPKNKHIPVSKQKQLVINPFSSKLNDKCCRKTKQKLKRLTEALKGDKTKTKKSLSDFLTLI